MIPAAFDYRRPATLAEALTILAADEPGVKLLAGGQSLLPVLKIRLAEVGTLVDIGHIAELRGIRAGGDGGLIIGAATRWNEILEDPRIAAEEPMLHEAVDGIGDLQVRNRGTIGGSLANNDPAACYPAAVLGLGATVHTDRRTIAADDFFKGLYETALADGEIITAVSFPAPAKAGWIKFKQPASRFSLVGVFVSKGPQGVRVAVTGAGPCVFRAAALEARLAANWSAAALAGASVSADGLNSDLHGSAEYRAALIPVLAARAVTAAG